MARGWIALTLTLAALGALVAALIETTVLPEIPIFGAYPDLLLTLTVVAAILLGLEDGMVWAFVGGLMIDLLTPGRPIGVMTMTLLLMAGMAFASARVVGPTRLASVVVTFGLSWVFHVMLLVVLVLTEGVAVGTFDARLIFLGALINMALAALVATSFITLERRFGSQERERTAW